MTYPITLIVQSGASKRGGGDSIRAIDAATGQDVTRNVPYTTLKKAFVNGFYLTKNTVLDRWRFVPPHEEEATEEEMAPPPQKDAVLSFLSTCVSKKPESLIIKDLTWKFICRAVLRGGNILLVGPTGCGKSQTAFAVAKALDRPIHYENLGATQDPRGALVGHTHFIKESGTFFNQSAFIKAIQVENSVILLDEISRAHPDAWNILMTVLDPEQRYVRLDESIDSPVIKVAKGVSFVATANVGSEYTATRVMDRALLDRFTIAEIPFLTVLEEKRLLAKLYPDLPSALVNGIAEIAYQTRIECQSESPKLSTAISTRTTVELGGLALDGFTLAECAEVSIYPLYPTDGGLQSERTYIKQLVQKYLPPPPPAVEVIHGSAQSTKSSATLSSTSVGVRTPMPW